MSERFGWPEHGEVQAGEERDETVPAAAADVTYGGE
jgi:hypothetical protein